MGSFRRDSTMLFGCFIWALLFFGTRGVKGGCLLFENHCDYSQVDTNQIINCYFLGDPPNTSKYVPPQNVPFTTIFSENALLNSRQTCPSLSLNNIRLNVYLEPCLEVAKTIKTKQDLIAHTKQLVDVAYLDVTYGSLTNCTPMIHNINESAMTEATTSEYDSGITITSTATLVAANRLKIGYIPKATVARTPFSLDGTCNVFGISMPKTSLSYLTLDNTACVNAAIPTSKDLDNALEIYGPDQLEVLRISKYFEDYNPTEFRIEFVDVETWKPYRQKYPGRSLISIDAKNDKKVSFMGSDE